ncbi:hypothetical protein HG530_006286 [Fusarium avenaceum]|nr:hypothetical protein HG530_006286 [Fusarium avenaceum]
MSELLLALEGHGSKNGSATGGKSVMLNSLRKVLPGAVVRRNVVTSTALPEEGSRLLLTPLTKTVEELVVAAQVSHIHLPVPVMFVLGVLHSENLEREMGATVDAMDISTAGVLDRLAKPAGVHKSHLRLAPERNQASKLGRNVVVDDSLDSPLVGPNGLRKLTDKSTEVQDGELGPLETSVCTDDDSNTSLLFTRLCQLSGLRVDLLESVLVRLVAILLRVGPVHVNVVNLSGFGPNSLVSRSLSIQSSIKTALSSTIAQAVRSVPTETIEANVIPDAK